MADDQDRISPVSVRPNKLQVFQALHPPPSPNLIGPPMHDPNEPIDFIFRPKSSRSQRASSVIGRFSSIFNSSRPSTPQSDKSSRKGKDKDGKGRKLSKDQLAHKGSKDSEAMGSDEHRNRDPLPDDKHGLEARLNYHLSELDRFKRIVIRLNEVIEEHEKKLWDVASRSKAMTEMATSLSKIQEAIHETRTFRNHYGRFIGYHRIELERVTHKGLLLKQNSGEELKLPEVMKNLTNEYGWRELFLV